MLVKKGDRGRIVVEIQTLLDAHGFWTYHKITDYFGDITEEAVKNFQADRGILVDGKVGDTTYRYLLEGVDTDRLGINDNIDDTDGKIDYKGSYLTSDGLSIDRAYLDTDEYVKDYGKVKPINLIIHHTAGWENPYNTISSWNRDSRGRVATQYVIGGPSIKGNTEYDGKVVECFPNGYLGWHTGKVGDFEKVSKLAVGIEINNFGYLFERDGKFYAYPAKDKNGWVSNYRNYEVPKDQVIDLGYNFRNFRYWHKYSEAQIGNLKLLIKHIKKTYPKINLKGGLPRLLKEGVSPADAFEFNHDAYYGRELGVWTHTNIRTDKFDCSPQPLLVELLKGL